MIDFNIPGEPKAKQRARTTKTGHAYTPQQTVNYENWVKACFLEEPRKKLEGAIKANITAYFSVPKSDKGKKREDKLNNVIPCIKRPDLDNIAKIVLDALNGLAYDDDKQVTDLKIAKRYSIQPRVEVILQEVV